MTSSPSPTSAPRVDSPLRNSRFLILLTYRICAILSYQIVAVAVGWHVYQLTGKPFSLGLIGLAEVLPYFCIAPFAGYLVDHLSRRKLGMASCFGLALTALALFCFAQGWLPFEGAWPIYAAIALTGMVRAFLSPVYNALFAKVLKRDQFVRGASVGSVVFQLGIVIGPAMGGLLIAWRGNTVAYATAGGFALVALIVISTLRHVAEPVHSGPRAPIFASIREGLQFVFSNQIMLAAISLDMFSVLFGGVVAMLPAFVEDILSRGPEGLGILRSAPAVGSIVAGLWLARHPLQQNAGRWLLVAVAAFGMCTIAFGLSRHFWLSVAILVAYGICDGISVVVRSTIMQLTTPDEMRGRVSSINGIFIGSSNELGAFYAGTMARLLGLIPAVIFGGGMTLMVVAITAIRAPRLRRLNLRDLQ